MAVRTKTQITTAARKAVAPIRISIEGTDTPADFGLVAPTSATPIMVLVMVLLMILEVLLNIRQGESA